MPTESLWSLITSARRGFRRRGGLELPIVIHVGDPLAFFAPLDRSNERLDELSRRPHWWYGGQENPSFDRLMQALATVVRRAPGTTFIGAHVGSAAEDLDWVGALMDECPNFHAALGARLGEIVRSRAGSDGSRSGTPTGSFSARTATPRRRRRAGLLALPADR